MNLLVGASDAHGVPHGWPHRFDDSRVGLIVGCTRSGTTWLDRMLRRLHGVRGVGEAGLGRYVRTLLRSGASFPFRLATPGGTLVLDKAPANVYELQHLAAIENARALHVVRDPRAVVASMLDAASSWAHARPNFSTIDAVRLWVRAVDEADRARRWWGDHLLTIRYEDLRREPLSHLRRAANHLVIRATVEEIHAAVEAERLRPTDVSRSGRFVRYGRVDGWKTELSAFDIEEIERVAGDRMARFGYVCAGGRA